MAAQHPRRSLPTGPGGDANVVQGEDSQLSRDEDLLVDLSEDTQAFTSPASLDILLIDDDSQGFGPLASATPVSVTDPRESDRGDLSYLPRTSFSGRTHDFASTTRGTDTYPPAAVSGLNASGNEVTFATMNGTGSAGRSLKQLGEQGRLLQDREHPARFSATTTTPLELMHPGNEHGNGDAYVQLIHGTEETHCHRLTHKNADDKVARNQLIAVVILCIIFMVGEAIGGALANSLALFTDVLHLASDLISFIISLLAICFANKPASKNMSFGYYRAEVLGALISVFIIWLVSGILCYIAVERIIHKHYIDVKANEMLITAACGVAINLIMGVVLHSERCCKMAKTRQSFGHSHSHHSHHSHGGSAVGSSRQYQPLAQTVGDEGDLEEMEEEAPRHKNINVRAAFIHVIGDIIQSIGVLIAALIIKFKPEDEYRLADPICTFLFSVLVLITTTNVLRDTLRVIMEGVPRDVKYDAVKADLASIEGVEAVHSLHLWSLTIDRNALAVHLTTAPTTECNAVRRAAQSLLYHRYKFFHMTIQVEPHNQEAMATCEECQVPR